MTPHGMAEEMLIDEIVPDDGTASQDTPEEEVLEIDPNLPCFLIVKNLVEEVFEESDEKVGNLIGYLFLKLRLKILKC